MRRSRTSSYVSRAAVLWAAGALLACSMLLGCSIDDDPTLLNPIDGSLPPMDSGVDSGDASDDGAVNDGGGEPSLLDAPAVERIDRLTLESPADAVQHAGEHTFILHAESGVSLLNLDNPSAVHVDSSMPTSGRAVAARFDAQRQIAWLLSESCELRAYRLTDLTQPVLIGSLQVPGPEDTDAGDAGAAADAGDAGGAKCVDFVVSRERLFVLQEQRIVPVSFGLDSAGEVGLTALTAVAIEEDAERIAEGGPGLYVAFAGGIVRSFTSGTAPNKVDEVSLRGDIVGWAVHGRRLLVALAGIGVRLVELRPGAAVNVLLRLSELNDPIALAQTGQLAVVALERGMVLALDLSIVAEPRGVAIFEFDDAEPPTWVATAGGNLLLGSESTLRVVGLPPIVESSVPASRASAVPRNARIPLRLSKPLNPGSVSIESVVARCDNVAVPTTPAQGRDGTQLTLLPTATWPASASCEIVFRGVSDLLGLPLTARDALRTFTTQAEDPSPIASAASAQAHVADGEMTGWSEGNEGGFEYDDIAPAQGMTADLYVDYDGERMWLLLDAIGSTDVLERDCYAIISGFTQEGDDVLEARIYGDGHTELSGVNGPLDDRITGGSSYGASPASSVPHVSFEAAIETGPGVFRFQLHLPSAGQDCALRQTDPISFGGTCSSGGCTIDPTVAIASPSGPSSLLPAGPTPSTTPTLSWVSSDFRRNALTYDVRVSSTGNGGHSIFHATSYLPTLAVPVGLLQQDAFYVLDVRAWSPVGPSSGTQSEFSVVAPCTHRECDSGDALAAGCSPCATAVCNGQTSCCDSDASWDDACVALAEGSAACACAP